ncbi:MAG TPA: hypothetical protein VGW38_18230, partial [Chloroflexota bacterium]|nr:hypothetical protein [Chloroflexota bacterium]
MAYQRQSSLSLAFAGAVAGALVLIAATGTLASAQEPDSGGSPTEIVSPVDETLPDTGLIDDTLQGTDLSSGVPWAQTPELSSLAL